MSQFNYPWNEAGWSHALMEVHSNCRELINWKIVYDAHDDEDKAYFDMLDQLRTKTK